MIKTSVRVSVNPQPDYCPHYEIFPPNEPLYHDTPVVYSALSSIGGGVSNTITANEDGWSVSVNSLLGSYTTTVKKVVSLNGRGLYKHKNITNADVSYPSGNLLPVDKVLAAENLVDGEGNVVYSQGATVSHVVLTRVDGNVFSPTPTIFFCFDGAFVNNEDMYGQIEIYLNAVVYEYRITAYDGGSSASSTDITIEGYASGYPCSYQKVSSGGTIMHDSGGGYYY